MNSDRPPSESCNREQVTSERQAITFVWTYGTEVRKNYGTHPKNEMNHLHHNHHIYDDHIIYFKYIAIPSLSFSSSSVGCGLPTIS